jgi:hypothetical protein
MCFLVEEKYIVNSEKLLTIYYIVCSKPPLREAARRFLNEKAMANTIYVARTPAEELRPKLSLALEKKRHKPKKITKTSNLKKSYLSFISQMTLII